MPPEAGAKKCINEISSPLDLWTNATPYSSESNIHNDVITSSKTKQIIKSKGQSESPGKAIKFIGDGNHQ